MTYLYLFGGVVVYIIIGIIIAAYMSSEVDMDDEDMVITTMLWPALFSIVIFMSCKGIIALLVKKLSQWLFGMREVKK